MPRSLFCVLFLAASCTAPAKETPPTAKPDPPMIDDNEIRFSGVISTVHIGAPYDGENSVVIGGKSVTFDSGGMQDSSQRVVWGKLIGFPFSRAQGVGLKAYGGKSAEVYAAVFYASGPDGAPLPIYSIAGDSKYFIKLRE